MKQFTFSGYWPWFALTVALFSLPLLFTGCYYETNDDIFLTFFLNGILTGTPVPDLSLYLHGFSNVISSLYQILPVLPWYGLVLYSLLFLTTWLAFSLVYRTQAKRGSASWVYVIVILFYLANWYEHIFWFNYSRLALLLAGVTVLHFIQTIRFGVSLRWWHFLSYGSLFFLALCVRPSLALFGLGLVLPALILYLPFNRFTFRKYSGLGLSFLVAGVLLVTWFGLKNSPAQKEYRQLDLLKSQVLDYNWCCAEPENLTDKVVYQGLTHWYLADDRVTAFTHHYSPDWPYFWQRAAFPKFIQLIRYLVFDHFLALSALFIGLAGQYQKSDKKVLLPWLGYQVYFWTLILLTGIFLKIPPRVLTPAISLLLLTHLSLFPERFNFRKWPLFFKVVLFLMLGARMYKIGRRVIQQQQRQKQSEAIITQIQRNYPGHVIIAAGLENELRALSPFRNYNLSQQPILFTTGWPTLDPHYVRYRQLLFGEATLPDALLRLSQRQKVIWVTHPAFVTFMETYAKTFFRQKFRFTFIRPVTGKTELASLAYYSLDIIDKE